jgi:hypothetical protein
MMATVQGASMLKVSPNLKFGTAMSSEMSPNFFLVPPSEYFVTETGFKQPPQDSSTQMPAHVSSLLTSWNVDTSKNDPQYLVNPNYMLKKSDGTVLNGITVLLQKSFIQNNLRILLHGGSSPTNHDDQLFFIDIDEENM